MSDDSWSDAIGGPENLAAKFCGQIDNPHHWVSHGTGAEIIPWVERCSICGDINGDYLDLQVANYLMKKLFILPPHERL